MSHVAQSDLDLGHFETRYMPFSPAAHMVLLGEQCCQGVLVPWEGVLELEVCLDRMVISVRPHECQDPVFLSRMLHCSKMLRVILFSCQWFYVVPEQCRLLLLCWF